MRKLAHLATIVYLFLFSEVAFSQTNAVFELPSIIASKMVLQQQSNAGLWGKARLNTEVNIKASWGVNGQAYSDSQGNWKTELKTPTAGGPFEIVFSTSDTSITITDVYIGEVWLCSGQSNMEMSLNGWPPSDTIANFKAEISKANFPLIRMFNVEHNYSEGPLTSLNGQWLVCNPATAGSFSATAYFFGRELFQNLNIPIGLVHSSWGGTPAEAWTDGKKLSELDNYSDILDKLKIAQSQSLVLKEWLHARKSFTVQNNLFSQALLTDTMFRNKVSDIETWPTMNLPTIWEYDSLKEFDGIVWFQKSINIPDSWNGKSLILELGAIDDMDVVYINGTKVGGYENTGNWNTKRIYTIHASIIKPGENTICIRVWDTGGGGGFSGNASELKIYPEGKEPNKIQLSGLWHYLPIAELNNGVYYRIANSASDLKTRPEQILKINQNTATTLYNAMIVPIINYSIKGVIWYQGESNVGRAKEYESLFPALISSWRNSFKQPELPFYFVQIAPYTYEGFQHNKLAELRDAQRKSLKVTNTGMVVTLDIGNVINIHPANKQDVGKRLSYWALAKTYGKTDVAYSGPLFDEMVIENTKIRIKFKYASKGLVSNDGELKCFQIAGADKVFVNAQAKIENNTVVVFSQKVVNPVAVRFAWKDTDVPNLFNTEGLPASSFRTDDW
jgi:sialate O-acetylesterase